MKKILAFGFPLFFLALSSFSQSEIEGVILSEDDNTPISYASIGVKNKEAGVVSDSSGKFSLSLPPSVKPADSVIITSIGYERRAFTVATFPMVKQIHLKALGKILNPIVIKANVKEINIGIRNESSLFFRAWDSRGMGGEVGQILKVPSGDFSIRRVRVKIDNKYDTCLVRLRIRRVVNNQPADDLVVANMIKQIGLTSSEDNIDFDIPENLLKVNEKKIYIGFEVLYAASADSLKHSICFIGNEQGTHLYKPTAASGWDWYQHFSLYIKASLAEYSD